MRYPNGRITSRDVHTLLGKAFIPNPHNYTKVDHINQDKSDNRLENLRWVTTQENSFNTRAKGYHYNKQYKKFQAGIGINGKIKYLGCHDTEDEARAAYLAAKAVYHVIGKPPPAKIVVKVTLKA